MRYDKIPIKHAVAYGSPDALFLLVFSRLLLISLDSQVKYV